MCFPDVYVNGMCPVQSPCAQYFEMSKCRVKKGLLIEKAPAERMGDLILKFL